VFQRSLTRSTAPTVQAANVPPQVCVGPEPVVTLLEEYLTFLQHHRGLREATLYSPSKPSFGVHAGCAMNICCY
jgi:hypothetical protein